MIQVHKPSPDLIKNQNQKVFTATWYYIRPKFGVYSCWQALFRLIIQRWNLNGGGLNLDEGDAKSRWGDANSRWEDASFLQFKYWV